MLIRENRSSTDGSLRAAAAYALTALGKTLLSDQRPAEATSTLQRALHIREQADPNPDELAETRFALARAKLALDPKGWTSARKLALLARDAYHNLPNHGRDAAEIDAWLARQAEVTRGPRK